MSDDSDPTRDAAGASSQNAAADGAREPAGSALEPPPRTEAGPSLGRFRVGELLGEGGMGRVYEAWDPRLKRTVAIKVLRSSDRLMVQRFVREARLQASVAHPGICPIYEVGEADGSPYIVMQRLYGRPLDQATEGLPLEQKLFLVRQVAEAVHEAHRTGLVHRDLKPANILVETPEGRPPHPWVVDFGLAKPLAEGQLTEVGAVVGTPAYMAPEQVTGEADGIDRRTDVYGLGSTLYRLLSGRSPFVYRGPATLLAILDDDPPPLDHGRGAGSVPAEVRWVVGKCMEKDPARRYSSARALADDLGRYLDGETVAARPVSRLYRVGKKVRRHKALAVLSALLVLLALGFGLFAAQSARLAEEREALARQFTEQVEELEALVRYSSMSPLHDVRPDRTLLRHRMAEIRSSMDRAGELGRGAGLYALGRGHLALGNLETAVDDLRAAWAAGYQTPEAAAALARALSAIYRERLAGVELVWDWPTRQRHRKELERIYGQPARQFLGLSLNPGSPRRGPGGARQLRGSGPDGPMLRALDHFHHERFADALAALDSASERRPWSFELESLEGDIRRTWAIAEAADGRTERARELLATADEAYRDAIAIAESAPELRLRRAQTASLVLSLRQLPSADFERALELGHASVEAALEADPDDARAWLWRARLARQQATGLQGRGEDPTTTLGTAIEAARRATALDPGLSAAWSELGRAHWGRAQWLRGRGVGAVEEVGSALHALDQVAPAARDYTFYINQARAYQALAAERVAVGEPAAEAHPRAIEAFRLAIDLHSSPFAAQVNLGNGLLGWVESGEADDRTLRLDQAVAAFEAADALDPEHPGPQFYLGRALVLRAQGGNPSSQLLDLGLARRAIDHYRRAAELGPTLFQPHNALGLAYQLLAVATWDRGQSPEAHFTDAEAHYARALEIAPHSPALLSNLAWTIFFRAKQAVRQGRPAEALLARASELASRAADEGSLPGATLCLGSLDRLRADARVLAGLAPGPALVAARQRFESLLDTNPKHAEAHRSLALSWLMEARWRRVAGAAAGADPGTPDPSTDPLGLARQHLDRALELEPSVASFRLADALWYLEAASARGDGALATRGLESTRSALALRPGWAEARAVSGSLLLARGALPPRSEADRAAGRQHLDRALADNPNLAFRWGRRQWLGLPR